MLYMMLVSYSHRYSIPIYDIINQLNVTWSFFIFTPFFYLTIISFFIAPTFLRLYFPIKLINTIAIFRPNPKKNVLSLLFSYYRYAVPLTAPGSICILILHGYIMFAARDNPEPLPKWLPVPLSIFSFMSGLVVIASTCCYYSTISYRFKKIHSLISRVKAREYIKTTKNFIFSSMILSIIVFLYYIILIIASLRNDNALPLVVLAPFLVILYYMFVIVVSGFYSVEEPFSERLAQEQPKFSYQTIKRLLQAKKALWVWPLLLIIIYMFFYPGLGRHTSFVLSYFNIGGGRPITIYVENSKKNMFHTDMWDERKARNGHIFHYPLRPLKLILLGESKTYVYDDQAGGCPAFDESDTKQCASTFSIPTDVITSIRMSAPKQLP